MALSGLRTTHVAALATGECSLGGDPEHAADPRLVPAATAVPQVIPAYGFGIDEFAQDSSRHAPPMPSPGRCRPSWNNRGYDPLPEQALAPLELHAGQQAGRHHLGAGYGQGPSRVGLPQLGNHLPLRMQGIDLGRGMYPRQVRPQLSDDGLSLPLGHPQPVPDTVLIAPGFNGQRTKSAAG